MAEAADFFVSYTNVDRVWAEWIAWQLEAEGYTVVVQAWDFTAGRDWVHEMQHASATAQRIVVVLSPAYLQSAHGEAEWRPFYAEDPSGAHGLLLSVRVSEVEPPGLLKTRIYVDLVDRDAESARAALLAAVRGARGKPAEEPEFPGARRKAVSAAEAPRFPAELPPTWNVPHHPNPYFTGRDLLLSEVHARLTAPEADRRRVVLTGLGGMGKTQLAVEHAYRQRADYDVVWWVRSEQPTSLLSDYAALALQPRLVTDLGLGEDAPQEVTATAVRGWLEQHRRWLLVLDNAEDPKVVAELVPRSATGHVLVTSRAEVGWEPLADPMPVDVLATTDAAEFLVARTRQTGPQAEAAATALAGALGGLPLALEQAAAYITAAGTVNLVTYTELFATRALELLKRGQPLGYQHTVATTWSLALQRLQQTKPAGVALLTLAACLAPDDLPQSLLVDHADDLPEPLADTIRDPLALADTVAALRRFSLVRVTGDGLYVHRLLQTVVRAALDTEAEATWAAAVILLLQAGFPHSSGAVSTWTECERLLPHVLAAADHCQRLDVEPAVWLRLLYKAAVYLWSRGRYREALTLQERALDGLGRVLGSDHPDTLQSMNHLAEIRRDLGEPQGACDLFEQTLAVRRRVLGADHPDTLQSMNSLAATRRNLGDLQGARQLLEQTLTTRKRVLGPDHPDTLWSMHSLALTRRYLGDFQGAHQLFEQTLAAFQRVLGADHPDTLRSMNSLAVTRQGLGNLQGARQLLEQTLTIRQRVLGPDHLDTLQSMHSLAGVRRDLGDLQGAHELFEQALSSRRRLLGPEHPDTLWSMHGLAATRRSLGDLQGACQLFEQVVAAFQRVLGADHPDTLRSMNTLAATRRDLGDLHAANDLHEQVLAGLRRALGDDHPDTLTSMRSLALTRQALGDLQGAHDLHEVVLAARRLVLGDDHPATVDSMNDLVAVRRELN
jgi:tetratricopeptide (TPR) repeat protein